MLASFRACSVLLSSFLKTSTVSSRSLLSCSFSFTFSSSARSSARRPDRNKAKCSWGSWIGYKSFRLFLISALIKTCRIILTLSVRGGFRQTFAGDNKNVPLINKWKLHRFSHISDEWRVLGSDFRGERSFPIFRIHTFVCYCEINWKPTWDFTVFLL